MRANYIISIFLILAASLVTSQSHAYSERQVYGFLGADLGFSRYSEFSTARDQVSRSGFHGGLRGLVAAYYPRWVIDGGLGWHRITNSGKNLDGSNVDVATNGFYLDSSARYRLNENWQIGPALDFWLSGDNGLNPNALSNDGNHGIFLGAQAIYEWMVDDRKFRVGGRILTDLNADGRSVNIFQLLFQVGMDWFGENKVREFTPPNEQMNKDDITRGESASQVPMSYEASLGDTGEEEDILGDPVPTPTPIPSPTPKAAFQTNEIKKAYVISLKESSLPFATGSAKLSSESIQELRSTGKFLGQHPEAWSALVVKGHTDSRGSKAINKKLSQARANEVKKWLVKGGSGSKNMAKKIKAVGLGSSKPIMLGKSETAWAKNRRVDLEFKGVKDAALLNEGVVIGR